MKLFQLTDESLIRCLENAVRADMALRRRGGLGTEQPLSAIKAFRDELLRRLERAKKGRSQ